MTYQVQIGSVYNMGSQKAEPEITIEITEDQFQILERFADVRMTETLEKTYVINSCQFKVVSIVEAGRATSGLKQYTI